MKRSVLVSVMWLGIAGSAAAQTSGAADPILTRDGVRYACTGVGASSREDPRWTSFAARVVFAAKDGGYLSEVSTRISDGQGRVVLEVQDCGPWLLLDLPPGRYEVTATAPDSAGRSFQSRATLAVGTGAQARTVVRFPEIAG